MRFVCDYLLILFKLLHINMERHMSTFKMQLDPKKDQFINKCRPICAEYYYRCLGSIVGDLLDYLNESWTHFHATGKDSESDYFNHLVEM